jgi:hypothetical protein
VLLFERDDPMLHSAYCFMAAIICAAVFGLTGLGQANMVSFEINSGAASPKKDQPNIRMDAEQVIIRLRKLTYTVDATFQFFNTGPTVTEWVGFPEEGGAEFTRFESRVEGKQVQVSEERDVGIVDRVLSGLARYVLGRTDFTEGRLRNRWLVHRATFPGGTQTNIRVKYEAHLSGEAMNYVIGTGSYWKDLIGRAVFVIDAADIGGIGCANAKFHDLGATPDPEVISSNVLKFELTNFKPPPKAGLAVHVKK